MRDDSFHVYGHTGSWNGQWLPGAFPLLGRENAYVDMGEQNLGIMHPVSRTEPVPSRIQKFPYKDGCIQALVPWRIQMQCEQRSTVNHQQLIGNRRPETQGTNRATR